MATQSQKKDSFLEDLHPRYPKGHPNAGKFISKKDIALAAKNYASKNKGRIATEGAVVAAGVIGSAIGSPVVGALASASMRSAITIGKKIKASTVKVKSEHVKNAQIGANALDKVADKLGANSISELTSPKFQRQLEKDFIGDLAFGVIDMAVSTLIPLPAVGSVVAVKTSGAVSRFADKMIQKIKKNRHENSNPPH